MNKEVIKLLKNLLVRWEKEQNDLVIHYTHKEEEKTRLDRLDHLIEETYSLIEELERK